jgi:hypothetical protein
MLVKIEFLGLARRLTGEKRAEVEVPNEATLRDVVRALAIRFPSLLGQVIVPQTFDLISPYFFNVGGRLAATTLEAPADNAEPLVLMSLEAGG